MTDAEAFRDMYQELYPRVLAYATSVVGRTAGEDITSETFAVAWQRWDDPPDARLPWLLGVAAAVVPVVHTESTTTTPALPQELPGLGPRMLAQVPANATQVVVVTGAGVHSPASSVVLYQRSPAGWQAGTAWPAHNALDGWTDNPAEGDLRTPIGVYGLTDAGGLLPDPGSQLPYTQSRGFEISGTGFEGEPLAGSFDYVLAINFNRKPGTDPLNWTRPLGPAKGGGVWFHVDHDGPTHGCVSLPRPAMITLLRTLDPADHPVVVMGDAASLAQ